MESVTSPEPIQYTPEAALQLRLSTHSPRELRKAGYVLSQLTHAELQRKKRCFRCCKVPSKKERRNRPPRKVQLPLAPVMGGIASDAIRALSLEENPVSESRKESARSGGQHNLDRKESGELGANAGEHKKPRLICKYHPGRVVNREWTCCNEPPFAKPCSEHEQHTPRLYKVGELEKNWLYHETPNVHLPSHVDAVAIDCEMGTANSGDTELIRVSVVDYFRGVVLLDELVYPSVRMSHYNTRFSGVTRQAMEEARRQRKCIFGRDAARQAVLQFVGPDTVVIGHSLLGDLSSLRWIHRVIIDTILIETRRRRIESAFSKFADPPQTTDVQEEQAAVADEGPDDEGGKGDTSQKEGGLSLKALAFKKLGRVIQQAGRGHDSVEDAWATRDLLHWYMVNPPSLKA